MIDHATDPTYLRYQYDDSVKLRIRAETHRRYTDVPDTFVDDLLRHLAVPPGLALLDVGCGPGTAHPALGRCGLRVVGLDTSLGMIREAREAAEALPRAQFVQGDAQALPFPAATFDRVLAAYVLYLVPDRLAALSELRRVLRPGGRAVLATGGAGSLQRLFDLHGEAARLLDYSPAPGIGCRFTLDDLPLVRSVFPAAARHVQHSALVFPEAAPALRFYASAMIDCIRAAPSDGSHRARLLPLVRERIEAILREEGVFRVPKSVGFFVADL